MASDITLFKKTDLLGEVGVILFTTVTLSFNLFSKQAPPSSFVKPCWVPVEKAEERKQITCI